MNERTQNMANATESIESADSIMFEQKLDEKISLLQQCQQKQSFTSCMQCDALLGCEVRDAYVKAVYDSMSKGQQGNFDFN